MNFKINKNEFLAGLTKLAPSIASKSENQIYSGILLTSKDNVLSLSAFSSDISMTTNLNSEVIEDGRMLIEYRPLLALIRKLPAGEISFEKLSSTVSLKSQKTEIELALLDDKDFPDFIIPKPDEYVGVFNMKSKDFIKSVNRVSSFAAIDNASKPILTGTCISITKDNVEFACLDGFRIAKHSEKGLCLTKIENRLEAVIDAKKLADINKILDPDIEKFIFGFTINHFFMKVDNTTSVSIRLLEGNYINYNSLFKTDKKINFFVEPEALLTTVDRVMTISKSSIDTPLLLIDVLYDEKQLKVHSKAKGSSSMDYIDIDIIETDLNKNSGENNITIGLNAKYLVDLLNSYLNSKTRVEFSIFDPDSPIYVSNLDNNSNSLILPVRINKMTA